MAEQNMAAATDTYAGFTAMVKYGTIATALIAAFVVLLIA
ncbi:aa3-type cytochrome c oxidase subunit IV [Sphingopyxis yananensis]|jgi:hypothetical protein|nr:aa3-type cytochrome c oxidase subunit IV [Sphingopyxis yananensis]MCC2602294.1 aa3-type cytochrome c oxidase subunit IV [Sphingopyxis yananensis]